MFSNMCSHRCFYNSSKMMGKRKRLVDLPYSDSESDDDSPKKKYLKKEESDSEGPPKKKPVRMIIESDSEDDFSPKKKPVRMIIESDSEDGDSTKKNPSQTKDKKTIDMRNLYDFNDVGNKKSRKFRTESHVFAASFKRF